MAEDARPDDDLVARLREGDESALRVLYARYAGLVFAIASDVAPAHAAEDVVQDVFLALWRKHETYDAARGPFKPWLARIAKNRALNERRRRVPKGPDAEEALAGVADEQPLPDDAAWAAHRREILQEAVDALPAEQRRALSLAFFDELSHAEVATALGAPLGTVKTRIRVALARLAPVLAVVLLVALVVVGYRWRRDDARRAREERALRMVTASDVVPRRLVAVPGVPGIPDGAHATYRARDGSDVAVLTTTALPKLTGEGRYEGSVRRGDTWVSFGTIDIDPDGRSLSIAEDPALASTPDEVRVARVGSGAPVVVLSWTAPR